ncbi:MAG: hypothetical protein ACP5LW_05760, partial [Nitrososphaeria archaeon]
PPAVQDSLVKLASAQMVQPKSDIDELAMKLGMLKAVLGGNDERIEELEKKISELLENKQKEEMLQLIQQINDQLNAQIQTLQSRLDALMAAQQAGHVQHGDTIDELLEEIKEVEEKREKLRSLLGIKETEELDVDKARKVLESMGYKVQGPMTPEEYERLLQKREEEWMRKLEEEVRKTKELAQKEAEERFKREKLLTDFASNIISALFENMTPQEKGGIASIVKKGLQALRGQQQG